MFLHAVFPSQVALTLSIQKSTLVLNNSIKALTQYCLTALLNTACSVAAYTSGSVDFM